MIVDDKDWQRKQVMMEDDEGEDNEGGRANMSRARNDDLVTWGGTCRD
jgi:hypothetical protein